MHSCRRQNGSWAAKVLCVVALGLALPASAWAKPPTTRGGVRLNTETPKQIQDIYTKSYAVVIGINAYTHKDKLPELGGAVRDAKAIATLLESRGFEVELLLDKKATGTAIKRAVTHWLGKRAEANDRVIIYFAGHGVSVGEDTEAMGYLMPVDAEDAEIDGIEMGWLQKIFRKRVKAKHVMYIADACYSGLALTRSAKSAVLRDAPDYYHRIAQARIRLSLTAGGKGDQAYEEGGHGVFTYHLLAALKGAADRDKDGFITSAELWPYLQISVGSTAAREDFKQTPQYGREGEGEMLFRNPTLAVQTKVSDARFFSNFVWRRGAMEGAGELTVEQHSHRAISYRFQTKDNRVQTVTRVNGSGTQVHNNEGISSWTHKYMDDVLLRIEAYDRHGNIVHVRSIRPGATRVDFQDAFGRPLRGQRKNFSGGAITTQGKAVFARGYRYDADGYVADEFPMNANPWEDQHVQDHDGSWGQRFVRHDTLKLPTETLFLNHDGSPSTRKDGVARIRHIYEQHGNEIATEYFGLDGQLMVNKSGYASDKNTFDARGNMTSSANFGTDGKPIVVRIGYSSFKRTFDARGNKTSGAYFDVNGKPILNKKGSASYKNTFDDRGNMTSSAHFGTDGKPILSKSGYASGKVTYDARGNQTSGAYFGTDGKPVLSKSGYASGKVTYDARGNTISTAYFGTNGKPILNKNGLASFKKTYDYRGNLTSAAYFDTDGKPVLHKNGYASYKNTYDARGNKTSTAYFGNDGKTILHKDGYATYKNTFDARGNRTTVAYFDKDGQPILSKDGYAILKETYDTRGNKASSAYFGTNGNPILNKDDYASIKSTFDTRGNATSTAHFGTDGKPILNKAGYASDKNTFDDRGNMTSTANFGTDGKPILLRSGFSSFKRTFDARGNKTSGAYFDTDGKAVLNKWGYASYKYTYDDRGNKTEVAYFGLDAAFTMTTKGYARETQQYTEGSSEVRVQTFDAAGKRLSDFIQDNRVRRRTATLVGPLRKRLAKLFDGANGIVVTGTDPAGQAYKKGARVGDILVRYGSQNLNVRRDFSEAIRDNKKAVELVLIRGEKRIVIQVDAGDLGLRTADL